MSNSPQNSVSQVSSSQQGRSLYQHLIAVAAILEVYEIDECGIPWIEYRSPQTTGHVNFLALCDDSRLLVP